MTLYGAVTLLLLCSGVLFARGAINSREIDPIKRYRNYAVQSSLVPQAPDLIRVWGLMSA